MQTFEKDGVRYTIFPTHFFINDKKHDIPECIQKQEPKASIRGDRLFVNGYEFNPVKGFDPYEKLKFVLGCIAIIIIISGAIYLKNS